jgi:hypothetical protein
MVGAGGPSDPPRQPLELWVAETATGQARRLLKSPEQGLSSIFDECAPPNFSFDSHVLSVLNSVVDLFSKHLQLQAIHWEGLVMHKGVILTTQCHCSRHLCMQLLWWNKDEHCVLVCAVTCGWTTTPLGHW